MLNNSLYRRLGVFSRSAVFLTLFLATSSTSTRADWIKGIFSPESGIDSLERFLVLRDHDDTSFFGWFVTPLGDISGDGVVDILVSRIDRAGGLANDSSFVFYGGAIPDTAVHFACDFPNIYGLIPIGDLNADGLTEVGVLQGGPIRYSILDGAIPFDPIADFTVSSAALSSTKAGYLLGTTTPYVAVSYYTNGLNSPIYIYDVGPTRDTIPEFKIPDPSFDNLQNLAITDISGDGYEDLLVATFGNKPISVTKCYFGGPSFDTTADFEFHGNSSYFGEQLVPVGDFNGDGYKDVLITGGTDTVPFGVYFGGTQLDDTVDVVMNYLEPGSYFGPGGAAAIGDINNDSYPDVAVALTIDAPEYYILYVFLGGPSADSTFDILIRGDMIPGADVEFGKRIFAVGDYNDDGIDDFAVYSGDNNAPYVRGRVFFFAGWDSMGTPVPDHNRPLLPKTTELKNNYPNPFNPSTTIEFDLPRKSHVQLQIFNLSGQLVSTLINGVFSAGSHSVTWNGRDGSGRLMASGIYFYSLRTETTIQSRKMILLK